MFKPGFRLQEEANSDGGEGGGSATPDPAVIAEAAAMGWVPADSFKGRKEEWVDAGEFVRRGKEVLPIVKDNLRRVQEDLRKAKAEIAEFGKTAEEFRKFTEEASERKYTEQLAVLKAQYASAVTDGEGVVAAELLDQIDEHKATRASESNKVSLTKDTPALDPEFVEWREANPWYEQEDLQDAAIMQGIRINKKFGFTGKKLFAAVKKEMAKLFPDDVVGDGGEDNGGMHDAGGEGTRRGSSRGSPRAKTFENLPKSDQEACDRMLKKGFFKTRKEYLDNYDWS